MNGNIVVVITGLIVIILLYVFIIYRSYSKNWKRSSARERIEKELRLDRRTRYRRIGPFPVHHSDEPRFRKMLKFGFVWKDSGLIFAERGTIVYAWEEDRNIKKLEFPGSQPGMDIPKGMLRNGLIIWFKIIMDGTEHYFTGDTGAFVFGNKKLTLGIYEDLKYGDIPAGIKNRSIVEREKRSDRAKVEKIHKRFRRTITSLVVLSFLLCSLSIYMTGVRTQIWVSSEDIDISVHIDDNVINGTDPFNVTLTLRNKASTTLYYSGKLALFYRTFDFLNHKTSWLMNTKLQVNLTGIRSLGPGETVQFHMIGKHIPWVFNFDGNFSLRGGLWSHHPRWSLAPCWTGIVYSEGINYEVANVPSDHFVF